MNNLVVTRGKEIIICLLIIILMLIFLLFRPAPDINKTDPRISANLDNFLNMLLDPQQNVHAVIFAAPDRGGKLVVFDNFLKTIEPCFESQEKLKPGDIITIEPECAEENFTRGEDQIVALTPGKRKVSDDKATFKKEGTNSVQEPVHKAVRDAQSKILWITEFDKKQYKRCQNDDGTWGPPCY